MNEQKTTILHSKLPSVMWQMSWPAVVAMVLYGMNNFLDGVFVGHLISSTALAAVGIAYPLAQFAQGFGTLVGTGIGSAISIWIGAGDQHKLNKAMGTVNFLVILFSVLVTIPCYIFAKDLVYMMGGRGEIGILATEYFKATILGTFFWIYGLALNMIIRAEGRMKTAAWMIAAGLIVDVVLKPVFIDTFGWGVAGAAWATNISMIIYSFLGIWYYAGKKASFVSKFWSCMPDKAIVKEALSLGMPGFIMMVMIVVQNVVIFNVFAKYGTDRDITFFTAVNRFYILLNTPLWGLMRALQPVAGMNYGAKKYKRTVLSYRLFSLTGLYILIPFWLFIMFFPEGVLSVMLPATNLTAEQLVDFRIYMSVLLVLPFIFMALVWLPSIENAKPATNISLLRQVVFYIPVLLVAPRFFGVRSIYIASAVIDWMMFILVLMAVYKGIRKLKTPMLTS
ncbi:MATE family efflux transporter [Elizabethkingia meningoseptica]|uniref:Multidrug export protein MepA n=1 Tax=Elizabethkingia meningoseptica TaxID=238 RepID=A0A1V3U1P6_ELIME|nr:MULTISPECIES: MATE family efflux transporter [Elizabethkingia]AQX14335.1 MATE family efflux transporter [Elizabethkingia meningoseptica]MBG0515492.1 MATE family efflux transporter [Elizabethkingia meningoseptica]MDE5434141.1 MATE family efflux transporter [Elizabethkingia meningoseptica]MDE5449212.1 MATE family efflux transporter [Elizabethkingia meningoseptica]MDE5470419.1 MATE family efflux transporter [Elizabethkingia meningoseptica]